MRINRNRSRHIFRRRSRWAGCISLLTTGFVLFVALLAGQQQLRTLFWQWIDTTGEHATINDAVQAYQSGDLQRTIEIAERLYASEPERTDLLSILTRALVYHSYADLNYEADRVQALALTTKAVEQTPYDMQVLGIHAFALQANGNADDAQRVALRVIRNDETNIAARVALSLAYGSQGIFEAALRDGLRAVEIANISAPDWRSDAHRAVAIAYSDLGRYDDAAQAVESAISYNRRLLALHFERALYAQQTGDLDTATAYYFNVIAFDDNNVKVRSRLCELSSSLGERDAAIDWCQQVTQLAPGWSQGWYWLGREYYLDGDWQNTQIALNRCTTLQVAQSVPIPERQLECWYIQGQAAEVLADCPALLALYAEYQAMSEISGVPPSWIYPDDTPPICITPQVTTTSGQ